ncbi:MAG TPA: hypothetical protein VHR66_29905 [Gemmataceae bacterium]|jgi:hypothetical protein|nr:hypothetical protein [Gemmataceae bacterium]
MALVYHNNLAKAGKHLVEVLVAEEQVPYSRFYNAKPGSQERVAVACGFDEDDEHAHIHLEWAAGQLERAGLVELETLDAVLIDDEPDFMIRLTAAGREFFATGKKFHYRDMEV